MRLRRSGGRDGGRWPPARSRPAGRPASVPSATSAASARHGGLAACAVLAALALTATACTASGAQLAGPRFVTPPLIHYSTVLWPVPLELVGAVPGSRLRIAAALDTRRGSWHSAATYTVPADGILDLAAARPQLAPFGDPDSAGLFWSLAGPELSGDDLVSQWTRETLPVQLTAFDGDRVVAARTFALEGLGEGIQPYTLYTRDLPGPAVAPPHETHEDQPVARFWSATSPERPVTPVVVMFDDPAPGASSDFTAPLLTRFGASVLVLPVSAAPDGVRAASVVDSATVAGLLGWLAARDGVDLRHVFAYGTGVSEPLALWAATRFPDRIHGVFAAGGAPALLCVPSGATAPAFENGVGLPCRVAPGTAQAGLVLPVGDVTGPVVLACGTRDTVLPSACAGQAALAAARGVRAGDQIMRADDARHSVSVPPGLPIGLGTTADDVEGPPQATERARVDFWNAVAQVVLRAERS